MNIPKHFPLNRLLANCLAGLGLALAAHGTMAAPAGAAIDMKLLVITYQNDNPAAINDAPELEAVKSILDRIGIPYDVHVYDRSAPTLPVLESEADNHARYQGIIMPISDPFYTNPYAPGATLAQQLERYQLKYGVRLASLYAWPGDTACLVANNYRDTTASPLNTTLTATGQTLFPYLKAGSASTSPLVVKGVWSYLSSPSVAAPTPATTVVTPVLQATVDGSLQTLGATCSFPNSAYTDLPSGATRETLFFTFDHNAYLLHSMTLSYGVVNWVTKGIFLGDRHVYLDPQPDDIGLPDDVFPYTNEGDQWWRVDTSPWTPLTGCPLGGESARTGITPCEYRMTGADFTTVVSWQNKVRFNTPNANALRINWPFNGAGFTTRFGGQGQYPPDNPATKTNENTSLDTLSQEVNRSSFEFKWVTHTFDHELLEPPMDYNTVTNGELKPNLAVKNAFGFAKFSANAIVTPEISGLYNADVLRAFYDLGIRYVVSDTSRPTPPVSNYPDCTRDNNGAKWPLPAGNSGKYNCVDNRIYEIPRYPTALFYNVSTPAEWTAEYNYFYGANGIDPTRWGVDLTYSQVLDKTSDTLLSYLLTYDLRPLMFHQANLRAYAKGKTLLGDLLDTTLAKYNSWYRNLPILSPSLSETGDMMKRRQVFMESGVSGVILPGNGIQLTATRSDGTDVVVPITGVVAGTAGTTETYGGQSISSVPLTQGNGYSTLIPATLPW